jgi:hypothetical protein
MWPGNNCTEDLGGVFIGKEPYMLGVDGNLMPVKKDRPPADLHHFEAE